MTQTFKVGDDVSTIALNRAKEFGTRLFVELQKRGYTIEGMYQGSRRSIRSSDSDTRYISKSETKRVEL